MKSTATTTKTAAIMKTIVNIFANIGIFILNFMSICSLILFLGQFDLTSILPEGTITTFSAYDAWGGINAFIITFFIGNSLMTYGLLKVKAFVKTFQAADLFEDSTITFLKKGAILMTAVGVIQGITEFVINPNHIILNFSLAGWLFIASFVLSYIKRHHITKTI